MGSVPPTVAYGCGGPRAQILGGTFDLASSITATLSILTHLGLGPDADWAGDTHTRRSHWFRAHAQRGPYFLEIKSARLRDLIYVGGRIFGGQSLRTRYAETGRGG